MYLGVGKTSTIREIVFRWARNEIMVDVECIFVLQAEFLNTIHQNDTLLEIVQKVYGKEVRDIHRNTLFIIENMHFMSPNVLTELTEGKTASLHKLFTQFHVCFVGRSRNQLKQIDQVWKEKELPYSIYHLHGLSSDGLKKYVDIFYLSRMVLIA